MVDAIEALVRPDDVVVEIGSQLREVSTTICEVVGQGHGRAVLVDVERKPPKNIKDVTHHWNSKGTTTGARAKRDA